MLNNVFKLSFNQGHEFDLRQALSSGEANGKSLGYDFKCIVQ